MTSPAKSWSVQNWTLQTQWGSFTTDGIGIGASNNIYVGSDATVQVFSP